MIEEGQGEHGVQAEESSPDQGPRGFQGNQGNPGVQGEAGPRGPQGVNEKGEKGEPGPQGISGRRANLAFYIFVTAYIIISSYFIYQNNQDVKDHNTPPNTSTNTQKK